MRLAQLIRNSTLLIFAALVAGDPQSSILNSQTPTTRPELALQLEHESTVTAVACSPTGGIIASGSQDGTVILWDVESGVLLRVLRAFEGGLVRSIAFSPDGRRLAALGVRRTQKERFTEITLWDVATATLLRGIRVPYEHSFTLEFSPDGETLASGGLEGGLMIGVPAKSEVWLWNVRSGELRQVLTGNNNEQVSGLSFSPDGKRLAVGGRAEATLWDVEASAVRKRLKTGGGVFSHSKTIVAFSPDGKFIATGNGAGDVELWDAKTGTSLRQLYKGFNATAVESISFSPDGKLLAIGVRADYGTVMVFDLQATTGQNVRMHIDGGVFYNGRVRSHITTSLSFTPDGNQLFVGVAKPFARELLEEGGVDVYDVSAFKLKRTLGKQGSTVTSVCYSGDGSFLAGATGSGAIVLWEPMSGSLLRTLTSNGGSANAISVSPDNKSIALASADRTATIWNVSTGALQKKLVGHQGPVNAVAYAPSGKLIATGGADGIILLWDSGSGAQLRSMRHNARVNAVAFSPDGSSVLSGGADKQAVLWDVQTGLARKKFSAQSDAVNAVAFSPDGKFIATGNKDKTILIWDVQTGSVERELTGHEGPVSSLGFSSDSAMLTSGSNDKTLILWDIRSGKARRTFRGHSDQVNAVAFSPSGRKVASAGADGVVKVWDVQDEKQVVTLVALPSAEARLSGGGVATLTDWLVDTAEGYYDSSPGAARFIKWRVGNDLFPVEAYESTFHRPDLVRKALAGEPIPATPEVQQFISGQAIPPQVAFITPREGAEVSGDELSVEVLATDDRSVERVELLVNGRPVAAKPITVDAKPITVDAKPITADARSLRPIPASHKVSRQFKIAAPLPPGESKFVLKAIAIDDQNLQGWDEIRITRRVVQPVLGDLHVLAVGVTQYRNSQLNLKYAAADAEAFGALWKRMEGTLYRRVHVTTLLDAQASTASVRAALFKLIETAADKDTVTLFVSGHGVNVEDGSTSLTTGRGFYFATHDIDVDHIADTALPWTVFQTTLLKLGAKHVVLFLDACHSGSSLGTRQAYNERLAETLAKRAGVMVFASSRGSELSYENSMLMHGAFTAALIEGIGEGKAAPGADGIIEPPELLAYLRRRVKELTNNMQTPTCPLMSDFGEPFPLAKVR